MNLSATSLWGYASGLVAFLVLISAPVLGGIADASQRKKSFQMAFCYSGAIFTLLLFYSGPGWVLYTLFLYCLAHYCFVGGNVFYDAFLPFLSGDRKDMDRLSGQGFALGYLGGGLLLALNVVFIETSGRLGIPKDSAVRLSLASAGVWWALFGTISFFLVREERSPRAETMGLWQSAVAGWRTTWHTTRLVARYKQIVIFLLAYMIYNDGVQTVIEMASIYGKEELGLSTGTLLGTLLMVQFIGIGGALFMSRVARRVGTRRTIMGALLVWLAMTVYAYGMDSAPQYWVLGVVVGLILGGTQALSRSFYGSLIPKEQAAQFFGYFSVFAKFSAIWGPVLFAFVRQMTGTARLSILSLSLFFLVGWVLLLFVRVDPSEAES
jgi:UMF1 family MFS transporter